jgi:hypothetical protein
MLVLILCMNFFLTNPMLLEVLQNMADMEGLTYLFMVAIFVFFLFFFTSPLAYGFHILMRVHG